MVAREHGVARRLKRKGEWSGASGICHLDYEARFLRRKTLHDDDGAKFLVNLEQTVSVDAGDAFVLDNGALIEIRAAPEPLYKVTGENLTRLAWHIGNRHTPCAVAKDHLLIRRDRVIAQMLKGLQARIEDVTAPFTPEGGAYGVGRTHGHQHAEHHHD